MKNSVLTGYCSINWTKPDNINELASWIVVDGKVTFDECNLVNKKDV